MEKRVLVVDDDQVVNKSFERVLTNKGYSVRTAMSGREAFEKFKGSDFDMVFTDLKMPGEDGLEVARRLKEMNPWLPIVVVTGYGTQEAEDKARAIGVAEFLQKPLSPTMIEEAAARVSARSEAATATETAAAVAAEPAAAPKRESVARNVALFFAAPFIGLAYILAFPFVGVYMIVKQGARLASGKK